jgi:hypothetical protein
MIDFTELWEKTIQSQYGTSPHIKGLIEAFAKRIDPTIDEETFYRDYFDPRTARGIGLDIWGVIVGCNRFIEIPSAEYFGFDGSEMQDFDNGPLWDKDGASNLYRMSDNAFRDLIFMKAYANISDATLPSIKVMLNSLFKNQAVIFNSPEPMMVRVLFLTYDLDLYAYSLFNAYGLFNLGAGVGWEYYIVDPETTFGFEGSGLSNFDNGVFAPFDIINMNS